MTGQSHATDRSPRFDYHVGFVSAPGGFDCSPQEFLRVAPQRTGVIQRVLSIQGYDQTLPIEGRARSFHLIEEAVMALGFSRCQVVGQVGSNWVHCTGTTPGQIEELCDDLGERANLTFLMAGHCIVMALRDMGARKITVSNGYYRPDWAFGINRYLEQAGFDICYQGNLIDQGIYPDIDALAESERATFWDYPVSDATRSLLAAHRAAPAADAIVVTGGGVRTLDCIDAIETMTGKPVVASDVSLYWAMLRALGAKPPGRDFGSLIRSLS